MEQFPALYKQGQMNLYFSWTRIIGWIMNGVVASLVIFLVNARVLSSTAFGEEGEVADIAHLGAITYTCVIWTVNCQIALILTHFTLIQHLIIWGSIFSWYAFLLLYDALAPAFTEAVGAAPAMYSMVTLLVVVISLLPYFFYLVIQRSLYPTDDHVIQEMLYCKKDFSVNNHTWQREQSKSRKTTQVGFSARVDARIHYLKEQLQQKKISIYRSLKSSPLYKSFTNNPFL
jgi:phospholipid-translocating ATPase